MKSVLFTRISGQRKEEVGKFVDSWKRSSHPVDTLEEGLRYLTSPKRETALQLMDSDSPIVGICCGYGKGSRPKLALSRADASLLLDIVVEIRKAGDGAELTKEMVRKAFSILLDGRVPASAEGDPALKRLLDILGQKDPGLKQGSLF
ncbi:MAG: hypothetical protein U0R44_04860 [Candidatus Micrarchaeia archaeon]